MALNITSKNKNSSNYKKSNYFNLTRRQVNLALIQLQIDRYIVHLPNDLEYLNIVCNNYDLDKVYKDLLIQTSKASVIPDESVSWLQNDLRAALWFDHYSYQYNHDFKFHWGNYFSDFQSNLIASFDLTYTHLDNQGRAVDYQIEWKKDFMNVAKTLYSNIRTKPQDLEWLNEDSEKQILWAHDYLNNQRQLIESPLFIANNLSCYYAHICASLDILDNLTTEKPYRTSLYKKDILNKMRGAWSQKKFRDKKDAESAQEYFLSRPYMNKLKKLSEAFGVTSKDYIQQLIDDAYNSNN